MNNSESPSSTIPVRILVVDDHPSTANTLARAIAQVGPNIEVISATSGEMALEQTRDGAVDLVITDMVMSGMSGLELIKKLQDHPAGRPAYTILITAYEVPGLKETARRLNINEVVIKPIRPERMCQLVGDALKEMGHKTTPIQTESEKPRLKILIADDLPDNVTLLSRYLQNDGYVCVTASDGLEALNKTRSEMPDLVLLDVNMPEKDGFEVLREIRSDAMIKHIPVIILTAARLEPTDMHAGLNLGADDYVTKPFDRQELLARIRTRLRVKEAEDVIRRRNKELSVLPEIGRELSARLDIGELTDVVLRRTVETLGAMLGHTVIFTAKGPVFKHYHFSKSMASTSEELPPLADLIDHLKETRQSLIIDDVHSDGNWRSIPGDPTRSVIIVPMFGRFDLLGLLILAHEEIGYFTLEHMLLLQAITSQAAIAVENAQLYADLSQGQQQVPSVLQNAIQAALVFDASGELISLNAQNEEIFAERGVSVGKSLVRKNGYDLLIDQLEETHKTNETKVGKVAWPDGPAFGVLSMPMEGGASIVLLYDATHSENQKSQRDFVSVGNHLD
jgi:CheY-like chemotaxis protein